MGQALGCEFEAVENFGISIKFNDVYPFREAAGAETARTKEGQ